MDNTDATNGFIDKNATIYTNDVTIFISQTVIRYYLLPPKLCTNQTKCTHCSLHRFQTFTWNTVVGSLLPVFSSFHAYSLRIPYLLLVAVLLRYFSPQ